MFHHTLIMNLNLLKLMDDLTYNFFLLMILLLLDFILVHLLFNYDIMFYLIIYISINLLYMVFIKYKGFISFSYDP